MSSTEVAAAREVRAQGAERSLPQFAELPYIPVDRVITEYTARMTAAAGSGGG